MVLSVGLDGPQLEVEEFIADDNMDEGERQLLLRSLTQPQIVAPPMPPIRSIVHHAPASRPPSSAPIRQSQEYEQNLINADECGCCAAIPRLDAALRCHAALRCCAGMLRWDAALGCCTRMLHWDTALRYQAGMLR